MLVGGADVVRPFDEERTDCGHAAREGDASGLGVCEEHAVHEDAVFCDGVRADEPGDLVEHKVRPKEHRHVPRYEA